MILLLTQITAIIYHRNCNRDLHIWISIVGQEVILTIIEHKIVNLLSFHLQSCLTDGKCPI